jgi:hypothetical protein
MTDEEYLNLQRGDPVILQWPDQLSGGRSTAYRFFERLDKDRVRLEMKDGKYIIFPRGWISPVSGYVRPKVGE